MSCLVQYYLDIQLMLEPTYHSWVMEVKSHYPTLTDNELYENCFILGLHMMLDECRGGTQ